MTQVKQCCKCGVIKPIEEFSKSYKDTCKECVAAITRESRAAKKKHSFEELKKSAKELSDEEWKTMEKIYSLLPTPDLSYKLPTIDWEQRRYEIAKAAMQGMLAHSTRYHCRPEDSNLSWKQGMIKESLELADELINQLKNTPMK